MEVGSVGYGGIQFVVSRIFFVRSMRSVSSNKNIYKSINVKESDGMRDKRKGSKIVFHSERRIYLDTL